LGRRNIDTKDISPIGKLFNLPPKPDPRIVYRDLRQGVHPAAGQPECKITVEAEAQVESIQWRQPQKIGARKNKQRIELIKIETFSSIILPIV
jgi:hypothetical protein